jgi:hypothetical protein
MYRQFNIQQFYFLPTQCIYVFCVELRTAIISLYRGPVQRDYRCVLNVYFRSPSDRSAVRHVW